MRTVRRLFTVFGLVLGAVVSGIMSPAVAFACSCVADVSVEDSFNDASAVFSGTATKISGDDFDEEKTIILEIDRVWKGVSTESVSVSTAGNSAMCGFNFQEGEKYLVYASKDGDRLYTGLCSRTALFANSQNTEELDSLADGVDEGDTSEGAKEPKQNMAVLTGVALAAFVLGGLSVLVLQRKARR